MTCKTFSPLVILALVLASCSAGAPSRHAAAEAPEQAVESAPTAADSSADFTRSLQSSERKMVRTADFRCRVADVFDATEKLENAVRACGGLVEESRMESSYAGSRPLPYTADSLKLAQTYQTAALLTLRIPVQHVDSIIRLIPLPATFIDHRTLLQQDMTLHYLSNRLKSDAASGSSGATDKARKSAEQIAATEYDDRRREQQIDRRLENMGIEDNVRYARVTVAYYQPRLVDVLVVPDPESLSRPPLGTRLVAALRNGWQGAEGFFVAMVSIWPLWLLALTALLLYRFLRFRLPAFAGRK